MTELKLGDRGPLITTLQNLLVAEKVTALTPTGYFGSLTRLALVKFQEKYRSDILSPAGRAAGSGTLSTTTRAKANSILAQKTLTTTTYTPSGTTAHPPFTRILFVGSRGSDVTALQEILVREGFFTAKPTVYFGPLTLRALKLFQEKYNIVRAGQPGYGIMGPKTRAKLNEMR
jgi:peptidoglycan hydrolase-like protein with peptidoglycan-binding domain